MLEDDNKRISELEEKLVEQEHRLPNILYNFFVLRNKWSTDDPRRDAAVRALIWRLLFSSLSITAASGMLTILILLYQNKIMADQNDLIREQNSYFQSQIEKQNEQNGLQKRQIEEQRLQWVGQRRAELLATLYGERNALGGAVNIRAKVEAVHAFIQLERNGNANLIVDLSSIDLEGANLSGADFSNVDLSQSNLKATVLKGADFTSAILEDAALDGANIESAQFDNAVLRDAKLTGVKNIGLTSQWTKANIQNIKGLTERELEWLKLHGAFEKGAAPMAPGFSIIK